MKTTQFQIYSAYARSIAIVLHKAERKVIGTLLLASVILGFLYVYFVGTAVVHAVVRKEVQQDIATVNSHIANLEVAYLQQKNTVTDDLVQEFGFTRVAQKEYVERVRYLGRANVQ